MSTVVAFDETKIDTLVSSYQDTEKQLIVIGSDEHLDIILSIQNTLKDLIKKSEAVSNQLELSFNSMNEEIAKSIVLKLSGGLRIAKQVIYILRNSPRPIKNGINTCLEQVTFETRQIDELVHDIIKYKLTKQDELQNLINEIK